jgi:hypothetical protein
MLLDDFLLTTQPGRVEVVFSLSHMSQATLRGMYYSDARSFYATSVGNGEISQK